MPGRPELASIEHRAAADPVSIRARGEKQLPEITGHASVFETPAKIAWFGLEWNEIVDRKAFDRALREGHDVRALENHDPNLVLGRTKAGTLSLETDDIGLAYTIDPPRTVHARDLIARIRRGDVDQSSFGFIVREDEWSPDWSTRRILDVDLWDVSVVTFPAYPTTDAQVNAHPLLRAAGFEPAAVTPAIARLLLGQAREEDLGELRTLLEILRGALPPPRTAPPDCPSALRAQEILNRIETLTAR